ncbi:hypothetical protein [Faecalibacter sp. LW9]|uniref:hypothetical protein n=1 Tax=Faecalibacter sp. LW9 TaxID=3103144 RepID=UPI002AFEF2C0|nr:hypothetical protein [Faecalibacter sp. LW9]
MEYSIKIKKLMLFIILFINIGVSGQENKTNFLAEIVILENENLKSFIDSIGLKNYYLKDGQSWYLDFRKDDEIKLANIRKSKLIQPNTNIYITIINDNVIFILSKKNQTISIKKTGLEVDLNKFNFVDLTFELSSYWILKEKKGKIKIISKSIYDGR